MQKFALATVVLGLFIGPALAQNQPQAARTHVRGTVEQLDGDKLVVKSRDGVPISIMLASNYTVAGVVKKSVSDIKAGDFVASTSVKGTDGKLHAIEVHFLPQNLRARIEGQTPADLVPNSLMTNAVVSGTAAGADGEVLKVSFKGNDAEVVVGPDVPVVAYVPGDASLLKPGAAVSMIAEKMPDGMLTAARVTAEKDGVKPPM